MTNQHQRPGSDDTYTAAKNAQDPANQFSQLLIRYMQDGFSVLDLNGVALDCNPALCTMTGFSREELVGCRPPHPYWPPEELDHIHAALNETLEGGVSDFELIFMRKSGERFPVIVSPFAVKNRDGETVSYSATVKDITEHKQFHMALLESEKRYRRIIETAEEGVWTIDEHQITNYVNPKMAKMLGYTVEEMMGRDLRSFMDEEGRVISDNNVKRREQGITEQHDFKFQRKDGTALWALLSTNPILREDGSYAGALAMLTDITERKITEEMLREVNQKMGLHFERTPMAVIEWDPDFCVTRWNPAAETIFGYGGEEAIGRHASFIVPDVYRHQVDEVYKALLRRVGGERSTNANIRKDGETIQCEWYNTALVDEQGRVTGIASLVMDITERLKADESLRELNRELEHRVAQRTAELEKAYDELLKRNAQFRALAEKLSQTENTERRRIARLLHDNYQQLLVAAKLKAEILLGYRDDLQVKEISRQVLEVLDQAIAASRSLTMELAPPILHDAGFAAGMHWLARWILEKYHVETRVTGSVPSVPLPMDVSTLLFEAVRELLFNVSKHSGVRMACITMTPVDEGFRISVSDEGKGFDVERVFEEPRSFGLFNIRERLALIDGELKTTSAPGNGTTIVLFVPLKNPVIPTEPGGPASESQVSKQAPKLRPIRDRIRILVADDHAVVREGLVQILSREEDMEIVGEAVDGLDAVEQTSLFRPDVVLMDVTMPRLNGLEATLRITSEFPDVKVVGLSMHAKEEMQPQMLAVGAVGYLPKNNPVEELIAVIHNVMTAEDFNG